MKMIYATLNQHKLLIFYGNVCFKLLLNKDIKREKNSRELCY